MTTPNAYVLRRNTVRLRIPSEVQSSSTYYTKNAVSHIEMGPINRGGIHTYVNREKMEYIFRFWEGFLQKKGPLLGPMGKI